MSQTPDKRRKLAEKVLDRIASDPNFRKQLLDNPHEAIEKAGFGAEWKEVQSDREVDGYMGLFGGIVPTPLVEDPKSPGPMPTPPYRDPGKDPIKDPIAPPMPFPNPIKKSTDPVDH